MELVRPGDQRLQSRDADTVNRTNTYERTQVTWWTVVSCIRQHSDLMGGGETICYLSYEDPDLASDTKSLALNRNSLALTLRALAWMTSTVYFTKKLKDVFFVNLFDRSLRYTPLSWLF